MPNKIKLQATRNPRCRCSRHMVGKNTFLPEEDSTCRRAESIGVRPLSANGQVIAYLERRGAQTRKVTAACDFLIRRGGELMPVNVPAKPKALPKTLTRLRGRSGRFGAPRGAASGRSWRAQGRPLFAVLHGRLALTAGAAARAPSARPPVGRVRENPYLNQLIDSAPAPL